MIKYGAFRNPHRRPRAAFPSKAMSSQPPRASVPDLGTLEQHDAFLHRHIGPSEAQIAEMLAVVGADSLDHLTAQTVPAAILNPAPLALPDPQPEHAVLERLAAIAAKNRVLRSLIGCGYHDTITPAVILRNVLENPGWYTAYTPYQPEISQGRLEGLLNFQQMIIDLTGLELANASLLDEGTAAAEAMTLCKRVVRKNKSNTFFVASDCHPQTIAVVRTRAEPLGLEVMVGDPDTELADADVFGALFQYPGTDGRVRDLTDLIAQVHARGALAVVAADLMSLLLLKSPGEMGADVALGNTQRFGVPMGFGGPHAAYFATRDEHKRSMPGRIIGVSIDSRGNQALRMAMQTREQHIRREKATSNICTSQALLALMAAFYAIYHGPERLRTIATRIHRLATILARGLEAGGFRLSHAHFFDTLAVEAGNQQAAIMQRALDAGINLRALDGGRIGVSLDERSTREEIETLWRIFCGDKAPAFDAIEAASALSVPAELLRQRRLPHAPDLQQLPQRDRDAALPAQAREPRHRAEPRDDPAGLLHHETERHHRDDPGHLARVRQHASLRAARAGRRLCRADAGTGRRADRVHRLRRAVVPAQLRRAGRVRRPAGDPPLPSQRAARRTATSA